MGLRLYSEIYKHLTNCKDSVCQEGRILRAYKQEFTPGGLEEHGFIKLIAKDAFLRHYTGRVRDGHVYDSHVTHGKALRWSGLKH